MPNVEDKYQPHGAAIVPDLVVKRVVKYDELSLDPLARLIRDPDAWSGWNDEAEVGAYPAVSWTSVRPDMHDRMHHRKLYLKL